MEAQSDFFLSLKFTGYSVAVGEFSGDQIEGNSQHTQQVFGEAD